MAVIPGVTGGGDALLCEEHHSADLAAAALGEAIFRAGGLHGGTENFGVAGGGEFFIRGVGAGETELVILVTALGAGRCFTLDRFEGMGGDGNDLLRDQHFAAELAVQAPGETGCGAGGSYLFVNGSEGVTGGNLFLYFLVTILAGVLHQTALGAGCRHHNMAVIPGVTQSGNGFLGCEDFAAVLAMRSFGKAGFGTGGFHGRVNDFGVTRGRERLIRTVGAGGAELILFVTDLGAGRRFGADLCDRMAGGGTDRRFLLAAVEAGEDDRAVLGAGGSLNDGDTAIPTEIVCRLFGKNHVAGTNAPIFIRVGNQLQETAFIAVIIDALESSDVEEGPLAHFFQTSGQHQRFQIGTVIKGKPADLFQTFRKGDGSQGGVGGIEEAAGEMGDAGRHLQFLHLFAAVKSGAGLGGTGDGVPGGARAVNRQFAGGAIQRPVHIIAALAAGIIGVSCAAARAHAG